MNVIVTLSRPIHGSGWNSMADETPETTPADEPNPQSAETEQTPADAAAETPAAEASPAETSPDATGASTETASATEEPATEEPDRKSTRLNSSHVVISYAVLCVKKKKNTLLTFCPQLSISSVRKTPHRPYITNVH